MRGGMATIANMVTERMAVVIDKGNLISSNTAGKGQTWCDVLDSPDEDPDNPVSAEWQNFKPITFFEAEAE
jgi:hypothetical protein